jgi:tRNA-dihydrouridine synthase
MFETTGVDGVMIGRAALHNPFIFRDIVEYAHGGQALMPVPAGDSACPPFDEIDRRIDAMQRYLSKIDGAPQIDKWKLHKARTVVGWFSRGIAHGKDIRLGLQDITTVGEVQRILDRFRESVAA